MRCEGPYLSGGLTQTAMIAAADKINWPRATGAHVEFIRSSTCSVSTMADWAFLAHSESQLCAAGTASMSPSVLASAAWCRVSAVRC